MEFIYKAMAIIVVLVVLAVILALFTGFGDTVKNIIAAIKSGLRII